METVYDNHIMGIAKRKIGFRIHLTICILVLPINWIIWYLTDTTYWWPIWPTLGWGLGILFHWLGTLRNARLFSITNEYEKQLNLQLQAKKDRIKKQA